MDFFWVFLLIFVASLVGILWEKHRRKGEVQAQFVVTGCLMMVFYAVCFCSGICTILNFIWRWIL